MKENTKKTSVITVCILGAILLIMSLWCWFKPVSEYSDSERRKLESFPEINFTTLTNGKFTEGFEDYTLDQFPIRDTFRTLKSISMFYVFMQKDNNDIYINDGYASKLDYPLNNSSVVNATNKFGQIYDKYLSGTDVKVHSVIIPDKNYFMAGQNGYPSLDYTRLFDMIKEKMPYAQFTDIIDLLDINDYYNTDTHWRQEDITDVAERIANALGVPSANPDLYTENKADVPFYGVYYGQSALPLRSETIYYLTSDVLDSCVTTDIYGNVSGVYNNEKLHGKDPYEMFMSGNTPIITLENPMCDSGRELVVFRDSFGSSLIPLLAEGYSKITLIDIRYIASDLIGNFVSFDSQDVLFLYSTLLYNSSFSFK